MFTKEHCCREVCKCLGLDKDVPLDVYDGHGTLRRFGSMGVTMKTSRTVEMSVPKITSSSWHQ